MLAGMLFGCAYVLVGVLNRPARGTCAAAAYRHAAAKKLTTPRSTGCSARQNTAHTTMRMNAVLTPKTNGTHGTAYVASSFAIPVLSNFSQTLAPAPARRTV